jgi:hypothetical protein
VVHKPRIFARTDSAATVKNSRDRTVSSHDRVIIVFAVVLDHITGYVYPEIQFLCKALHVRVFLSIFFLHAAADSRPHGM